LYSSSITNFPWLSPIENWLVPESKEFCHLYSRGTDKHHRKHMTRDHNPALRYVTADMENTASSIVACWTVFTELLPGNALLKSVTILIAVSVVSLLCKILHQSENCWPFVKLLSFRTRWITYFLKCLWCIWCDKCRCSPLSHGIII
jgi:hypothetical protein